MEMQTFVNILDAGIEGLACALLNHLQEDLGIAMAGLLRYE